MWYLEMGGNYIINNNKVFGRKIYVEPKQLDIVRKKFNNIDVYSTVYIYNKPNQNDADLYGPLYIDLDMSIESEKDYDKLKKDLERIVTYLNIYYGLDKNQIKYYFSGYKGFHLIIDPHILQITPDNELNVIYKEFAKELDMITKNKVIDLKIYDKKRLLRLPNSINSKSGLYKVPITYSNIMQYTYAQIKEYAKIKHESIKIDIQPNDLLFNRIKTIKEVLKQPEIKKRKKKIKYYGSIADIKFPKCIMNIWNKGAKEGLRNNTTMILASCFLQQGLSYDDVCSLLIEWNEKNEPMLTENEIKATLTSAYSRSLDNMYYGCTSIKDFGLCVNCGIKL